MEAVITLTRWVNLLPDPCLVLSVDGRVLAVNRAGSQALGTSPTDWVGRAFEELVEEPKAELDEYFRTCTRSGDPIPKRLTWRAEIAESAKVSANGGFRTTLVQPFDAEDDPVLAVRFESAVEEGSSRTAEEELVRLQRELDRRKRVELELQASQARLHAIVDTAVDAIILIDERGAIESINRATERLFGYRAEEVLGHNVTILMPSPYREEHDGYMQHYLATGERRIIGIGREVSGRRKDGTAFPLYLAVSEVPVDGRRFFAGIVRDLSEERALHNQIRQQEKLAVVGQLASGLAHEIGNPLSSISAVVQNLRRKIDDGAIDGKLALIETHIDRLVSITRRVSQLGRPVSPDRMTCSINDAIENGVGILQYDKRAKNVEFRVDLDPELPLTVGVSDELSQVFMNLGLNAIDALQEMPDGHAREVRFKTARVDREHGSTIRVEVEDNGPGMTPEVSARILDPFFTTKDPGQGTGLGLAVSLRIVEEHGGRIEVDTEQGRGTLFVIELPVVAPAR